MASVSLRPGLSVFQRESENAIPTKSYTAPTVDDQGYIIVRKPGSSPPEFKPPKLEWLGGKWYFTHSTLPIWKDKRNVSITYTVYPHTPEEPRDRIDDIVSYLPAKGNKIQTVQGREYSNKDTGAWDWRGKGIIKIASSHWEILAWGGAGEDAWMVTYFIKTVFTPAAIDIYHRKADGISQQLYNDILERIASLEDPELNRLVGELYIVKHEI